MKTLVYSVHCEFSTVEWETNFHKWIMEKWMSVISGRYGDDSPILMLQALSHQQAVLPPPCSCPRAGAPYALTDEAWEMFLQVTPGQFY